jgi:recombination associated protein RdgC
LWEKEEKVLPAAVVNKMVQEKILEAEDKQGHKLSKKERIALKDELIFELLPRAFTFSSKTYAYIDSKGGWLIVDAASAKKAEDLFRSLRKCLGSLLVVPLNTLEKPITDMTAWLINNQAPEDIPIEDECELRSPENEAQWFDVDFSIMSLELSNFLPCLMELFGGENKHNPKRAVNFKNFCLHNIP